MTAKLISPSKFFFASIVLTENVILSRIYANGSSKSQIKEENIMPKVGIVMGSDSDMPVMSKAADILEKLGIEYEMRIIVL